MIKKLGCWVLLLTTLVACSSPKWMVEDQYAIDRNDFDLINSVQFLEQVGQPTPQAPFVQFQLKAANTFEYAQRVRTDRYIQRYRPSFKSILLGVAGAGLATGSALLAEPNSSTRNVLLGTAGFITLTSFLNMTPHGEPTPTGESRLLRRTGKIMETDTVNATPIPGNAVSYTIFDNDEILAIEDDIPFTNGRYTINLLEAFSPDKFEYDTDRTIALEVYFNNDIYLTEIPLSSFLERFVVVDTEVTPLRDQPVLDSRSILTDLAKGSQMKLVEEDSLWYKVLYGISETYVSKSDASLIWRPSEFAEQLSIITVPNIPFGSVDVERDLPVLASNNQDRFAFILANREHQGEYSERNYAERDARLMQEYLQTSFNFSRDHVQITTNVASQEQLILAYNRFANKLRGEHQQLVVYVSGYVREGENQQTMLIGTGTGSEINLNSFFNGIANLPVQELVVFLDLDNVDERSEAKILEKLANQILDANPNSAIVISSTETQRSRNYSTPNGEQKRHSIFTYFIADAMKKGAVSVSEIVNHLQRNVDYTSRRLHNQPQHILFFGRNDLQLVN